MHAVFESKYLDVSFRRFLRCQAMSVIQTRYPSVEHRLKDYIAKPKPNGYQSLHATQLVPDVTTSGPPVVIEFQVLKQRNVVLLCIELGYLVNYTLLRSEHLWVSSL